jgi:hypothetical protein
MEDNAPQEKEKENPPADFNKLDLSQLQGFSFGTQWTQDKSSPSDRRERREGGDDRPRRDGGGGPGGADRRDRRAFRRPAGPGDAPPAGGGGGAPVGAPERREFSGDRRPRRDGPGGGGEYRGGPRREGPGGGGPRYERGGQGGYGGRGGPQDRGPYDSPFYNVTFYPEDTSFNTLVQTIRKSCRTVELFEIARTVVAKPDRFVVVIAHKPSAGDVPENRPAPGAPAAAVPVAKPEKRMFYISVPDGMPFETDDAAVAHVLSNHLDKFFDRADVDVEPPKGNFQVINKCGVTGELLGPPNYHRYNQIVMQHHAAKLPRMPFETFKSRIETIRDPEVVNQWLAKMKKATRYTWKNPSGRPAKNAEAKNADAAGGSAAPATAETTPAGTENLETTTAAETATPANAPAEAAAAPAEAAPAAPAASSNETAATATPSTPPVPTFDTLEDARVFLLTQARDKVVRTVENARVHGKVAETMPPGEIRRAIEGALERQRRFPLDTANALRGRLRREHFTIFKKGSKGVSYVCAVKRKFRVPGQTFSDSIGTLISFIEANPMIRASELQTKLLGIAPTPVPAEAAAPKPEGAGAEGTSAPETPTPAPAPSLTIEERAKLSRLQGDLMWLVREGYVTEFIDGRLFAPPPMVEARKKEIESEDHDPENFPEAPASAEPTAGRPAPAEATEGGPASGESTDESAGGESSSGAGEPSSAEPAAAAEEPAVEPTSPPAEPPTSGS